MEVPQTGLAPSQRRYGLSLQQTCQEVPATRRISTTPTETSTRQMDLQTSPALDSTVTLA